jgi:hypothetical protein
MAIHIVSSEEYMCWNEFTSPTLYALCGAVIKDWHAVAPLAPWTEFPCDTNPDKVCPECRDHPEYAMILLRGENLYE